MRNILSRPHLHELAVSSGFCKRSSKMSPEVFFDLLFHTVSGTEQGSLSYMVSLLESEFGIKIKKQSLHERFTQKSVAYVEAVLREVLGEHFAALYSVDLLPDFERIRIKDSTKFITPPTLSAHYKSCGKGNSGSSISIQYEYDMKSGSVTDLQITSGARNDRTDAMETFRNTQNGDLIIRDMGYLSLSVLKEWINNRVSFLSRLDCATTVYNAEGEKISFADIYRYMAKHGITEQELSVYAGEKAKVPVRLILQTVPDTVYEQRIREKTRKSKGQGREHITEETKIRSRFTLFITNAEPSILPAKTVFVLYRLRWQIELQFKVWKSVFRIDTLHRMKEHRYITLLYIKLLLIMLDLQIIYSLQQSAVQEGTETIRVLSMEKSMKTLKTLSDKIFVIFRGTICKAEEATGYIQKRLLENHWLESKNKKLCFPEILQMLLGDTEE
jgi:hypothetical protein